MVATHEETMKRELDRLKEALSNLKLEKIRIEKAIVDTQETITSYAKSLGMDKEE